ncbi:MAG: DNA primase [Candidatus Pacebacteria bacterium]|nr:DNA primase [Candidatus Paceibacterota bacterium]
MSQVNQVKQANDIVDVLSERLDLKRAGSSYKAVCPFHNESTPSFFVNQEMQRYKCFGCAESGDVIEFLEKYEGMSFLEALKYLADRAGIVLKQYHRTQADEQRETLLGILDLAKQYYHYLLTKHELGKKAQNYLESRQTTNDSIKLFGLGYAPEGWRNLYQYLVKKKKYKPEMIEQAGLIIKSKNGRYYDRFRDRIMFPLKNHRGQVVGFSGRALEKDDKTPKYINSPETDLYHKSEMLFGYSELFSAIREKRELVLVEGEFDVISSAQAHVNYIAAIKGSALTEEQIKLIKRTVDKVTLCLDSDQAGVKATLRAIELIKNTELDLRVIDLSQLPTDLGVNDVDDLARKKPDLWRQTVKNSISPYDFLIRIGLRNYDQSTPEGKRKIIDFLAPALNNISHQVEKDFYLQKVSEKLGVRTSLVAQDVEQFGQLNQGRSSDSFNQSVRSSQGNQKNTHSTESQKMVSKQKKLEQYLFYLLLRSDSGQAKKRAKQLQEMELSLVGASQVLTKLVELEQYQLKALANQLPEDLKAKLFDWYQTPAYQGLEADSLKLETEWKKTVRKWKQERVKTQLDKVYFEIEKLENKSERTQAEEDRLEELLAKIVELQTKMKS